MGKLKKYLSIASMGSAGMLASLSAAEKGTSYETDTMDPAPITMSVDTEKSFNLPGGISIKKSELDKIKQDNPELSDIGLLTAEENGFDGLKMKLDDKTHFVLMDGNSFSSDIPSLMFLTSKTGDLSNATQMSERDFKKVNDNISSLVVKLGKKGAFDLDGVITYLKDEAKKQGYPSAVLMFAGPETLVSYAMEEVFEARNKNTPPMISDKTFAFILNQTGRGS